MDRLSWAIGHKFSAEPVRCSGHIDNNVVAARFNENSSAMAMGLPVENSSSSFVFADLASHQGIKMTATNDGSD